MLNERLLEAMYVPADKRLLRRLCQAADFYHDGDTAEVPLTQEQLAELAGTSRHKLQRQNRHPPTL